MWTMLVIVNMNTYTLIILTLVDLNIATDGTFWLLM